MAVLTATQLDSMRQALASRLSGRDDIDYSKTIANAAFQATEDWSANNATTRGDPRSLDQAINAATSPYVYSATAKRDIDSIWKGETA